MKDMVRNGDARSVFYLQFDQHIQPWKLLTYDRSKLWSCAVRFIIWKKRVCDFANTLPENT